MKICPCSFDCRITENGYSNMFRTGLEKSLKTCHNPGKVNEDFA